MNGSIEKSNLPASEPTVRRLVFRKDTLNGSRKVWVSTSECSSVMIAALIRKWMLFTCRAEENNRLLA